MVQRSPRVAIAALAAAATAVTLINVGAGANAAFEAPSSSARTAPSTFGAGPPGRERVGYYDARQATDASAPFLVQRTLADAGSADVTALRKLAGGDAVLSIDPVTGTPDNLSSLDGYLTRASSSSATRIVLSYVRAHADALGLTRGDIDTFSLRSTYTDPIGSRHLSYIQKVNGISVFGNGLRAHVDDQGRIISLQGAPVSGLAKTASAVSSSPEGSAASARAVAASDVGGGVSDVAVERSTRSADSAAVWSNGDRAQLVWFATPSGLTLGWSTYTQAGGNLIYSHVISADGSQRVLYRRDLVDFDRGDALVYENYPGARRGGTPEKVNFFKRHWLNPRSTWLNGRYVKAWSDVNDDNRVSKNEKTPVPGTRKGAQFRLHAFTGKRVRDLGCSPRYICGWNPNEKFSWRTNRKADVTNAFFLASRFHDYLKQAPIGFTGASGNFETRNGDPLLLNAMDGANTANGLPDANHLDNANMATPPDGTSPTMQMYLWHQPDTPASADPFIPQTGSLDASILLHEYTHGLSNRLVVDASGNSTLNSLQAGSMGEAWSDYYAEDYLVHRGFEVDSPRSGDVKEAEYTIAGGLFRTEAIDCAVGARARNCQGPVNGKKGGYTYGDVPTIGGSPEVHSSGEVWAQTLWDIRRRFGHRVADMVITRAMELSPADPSMLDMRNAIMQADKVAYDGRHQTVLWRIFANRGFGWFAGSLNSGDSQPAEDFHVRPAAQRGTGTLFGLVTDANTGQPISGAVVSITGHDSGYIGSYTDRTRPNGVYQIDNVKPGTYKKVVLLADGYEIKVDRVRVTTDPNGSRHDFSARFDYAASSGGGQIADFNGPDYSSFGCGPGGAIDLNQGTGWGSTTGDDNGTPTDTPVPKFIVIQLADTIDISTDNDVTAFSIDPSATCGDSDSASVNTYKIEASADGIAWTTVVDGSGDKRFVAEDIGRYNNVAAETPFAGANFIRFTMLQPQVFDDTVFPKDPPPRCPDGAFSGCSFMDMTEVEVFGSPTAP